MNNAIYNPMTITMRRTSDDRALRAVPVLPLLPATALTVMTRRPARRRCSIRCIVALAAPLIQSARKFFSPLISISP